MPWRKSNIAAVEVWRWGKSFLEVQPGELVIEALACRYKLYRSDGGAKNKNPL